MRPGSISCCLVWLASAALTASCAAQVMQDPGTLPDGRRMQLPGFRRPAPQNPSPQNPTPPAAPGPIPSANPALLAPTPLATPAPARTAPSLLDKPAQAAKITFAAGRLSVSADNSSLTEILHQLAASSGMTVDGISQDQRIFGEYGPGNPRDILSSLLDDAGYNVVMVGITADGAPRQLILSERSNAPASTAPANNLAQQDDSDQDEVPLNNYPPAGEIQRSPVAPVQQQNPNGPVRTPQQMLQELQQMRERQLEQQQSPQ
jgi:hypothetical protein